MKKKKKNEAVSKMAAPTVWVSAVEKWSWEGGMEELNDEEIKGNMFVDLTRIL